MSLPDRLVNLFMTQDTRFDCPEPEPDQIGIIWNDPTPWCSIPLGTANAGAMTFRAWAIHLFPGSPLIVPVHLTLPAPVGHQFSVLHAEIVPTAPSTFSSSGKVPDI